MTRTLPGRPTIPAADVPALVERVFGRRVDVLGELPSDRDRNFRLQDREAHSLLALKVANAGEPPALVDLQDAVLDRLAGAVGPARAPRRAAVVGAESAVWHGTGQRRHR